MCCHDCGCEEGELHELGCDMERCPFCGEQLISCACSINLFEGKPFNEAKWIKMLNDKGRIPFVLIPIVCALCGKLWPNFFMADDWGKFVIPELQAKVLCKNCYVKMKKLFPNGWKRTD